MTTIGFNGHAQYGSCNNLAEEFLQIYTSVRRQDIIQRSNIRKRFTKWLQTLKQLLLYIQHVEEYETQYNDTLDLLINAFIMIIHVRDKSEGFGECRMAYSFLLSWEEVFRNTTYEFSSLALANVFISNTLSGDKMAMTDRLATESFGSYKDFKYFAHEFCSHKHIQYMEANSCIVKHNGEKSIPKNVIQKYMDELVSSQVYLHMEGVMIEHLLSDYTSYCLARQDSSIHPNLTLAAKWAPRENGGGKFSFLAKRLAEGIFASYMRTSTNGTPSRTRAQKKAMMEYRKLVTMLNQSLRTVQINQCNGDWKSIDFDKQVTSLTMSRQREAFLNMKHKESEDRIQCAENYKSFVESVKQQQTIMKSACLSVNELVKSAIRLKNIKSADDTSSQCLRDSINMMWEEHSKKTNSLDHFIAMVDTSSSMDGHPMETAIGIGLRIAEKSLLGNRIMTFSSRPSWIQFDDNEDFVSRVHKVMSSEWGLNTNFYAAFELILEAIKTLKLPAAYVSKLTLVILSDMQMDASDGGDPLDESIVKAFANAGMETIGTPYPVPRVVFWNLGEYDGFPTTSSQKNAVMVSSTSVTHLNAFCEIGHEALENITPYSFMKLRLEHPRYTPYREYIRQLLNTTTLEVRV